MAFPISPVEGDTYTENNTVWIYSAVTGQWNRSIISQVNETTYIGSDGAPGGIGGNTQVIFNDNGSLASDAGLGYNKTTDVLTTGSLRATSLGTAAAPTIAFTGDTNTGIYSPGADQVAVATNGAGRLYVTSLGRVGVNTDSPGFIFQIQHSTEDGIRLRTANTSDSHIDFADTDANGRGRINYDHATDSMGFRTAGAERLRITSTGQLSHIGAGSSGSPAVSFSGSAPVNSLVITSAGLVGIGTTSPGSALEVVGAPPEIRIRSTSTSDGFIRFTNTSGSMSAGMGGAADNIYQITDRINAHVAYQYRGGGGGFHLWSTNNTERARIDSSGRLLVGTSSARTNFYNGPDTAIFQIEGALNNIARFSSFTYGRANSDGPIQIFAKHRSDGIGGNTLVSSGDEIGRLSFQGGDGTEFVEGARIEALVDGTPAANDMPGRLVFSTTADGASSATERMRIKSDGNIGIGYAGLTDTVLAVRGSSNGVYSADNTQAQGSGWYLFYGTSDTGTVLQAWIRGDGTYGSRPNVYGGTSDAKLKENIEPASSQWEDIKSLQVKKFNFIGDDLRQIGVIAQEVEEVSPGLVDENIDRDADGNDLGTVTKSVKYSILYMKAVKALQEAMERIETLEAAVTALQQS